MSGSCAEDGVFWPCPDESHPGTPRMFFERFGTDDGRARFHPVEYGSPPKCPTRTTRIS